MSKPPGQPFDPNAWTGAALGAGCGGGITGVITAGMKGALIGPTSSAVEIDVIVMGATGIISGFIGGGVGVMFSRWFDDPPWQIRDRQAFNFNFLFAIVFSTFLGGLFLFPLLTSISTKQQLSFVVFCITFLAGFIAAGLIGVIYNIHAMMTRKSPAPPTEDDKHDKTPAA